MRYLIYSTQKEAQIALNKIFDNAVQTAANDDRYLDPTGSPVIRSEKGKRTDLLDTKDKLYNIKTRQWVEYATLDKVDCLSYPILGYRGGKLVTDSGFTTSWDTPREIELGLYKGSFSIANPENDSRFSDITGISRPRASIEAECESLFKVDPI